MRIAVLILVHKNLSQLEMLVKRLQPDFDVYIHIDQKIKFPANLFNNYINVFIINKYKINWGSYNQIMATYELFRTAHQKKYNYYLFISGQDIPIKKNEDIIAFLEENKEYSYINYEKFPKPGWLAHDGGFDRVKYYWGNNFENDLISQAKKKVIATVRLLQKKFGLKRSLLPITYYGGWNWLNLNQYAMNYLLDFVDRNPNFLKSFKYTHCADEIWAQTILLNSDCIIANDNLRFVNWIDPTDEHPKTLTIHDLDEIRVSKALFARKFDVNVDAKVIELIFEPVEKS